MSMTTKTKTTIAAIALSLGCAVSPALAQDLSSNISCFNGAIDGNDFAELTSDFREATWDSRAGVNLVASHDDVKLKVLDPSGNSVCEDEANLTAQCIFRLRTVEYFTIIVDNSLRTEAVTYRLCAF